MSDQVLSPGNVRLAAAPADREEAIRAAGGVLVEAGAVTPAYVDAMLEREQSVSTYMGNLLAIPHGTNESKDAILRSALSFTRYDQPVDWGGDEVRFVVGIAGVGDEHLDILSRIAIVFSDEDEVERLLLADGADALYAILEEVNG
ncbi:PTS sugar transporter subunit IIA [Agromyces rhizosphaerae]|nr:PTS sugar transporter subunit IIA [Agromyces rhizosphaerae]